MLRQEEKKERERGRGEKKAPFHGYLPSIARKGEIMRDYAEQHVRNIYTYMYMYICTLHCTSGFIEKYVVYISLLRCLRSGQRTLRI